MMGIHNVFPPDDEEDRDPISKKKLTKGEGRFSTTKTLLGFDFDGIDKTLWLCGSKNQNKPPYFSSLRRGCTHLRQGVRAYGLENSNLSLQKLDMPSYRFLWELDSCHHAIKFHAFSPDISSSTPTHCLNRQFWI